MINIFPFIKKQGLPASVSVSRTLMSFLGTYYPEVLSRSYVLDAPWQIRTFIGLVWPVIDWSARRKIKICPADIIHKDGEVPTECLLKDAGGDLDVPWDAEAYWDTLIKTCREKREEHLRRWREHGARCGLEERLFKVVERDPNETLDEPGTPSVADAMSEGTTAGSSEAAFTPPAVNAYTAEHGIKQWKDNWSYNGTKSSPNSVRPNMTSTSLESQIGLASAVRNNERWIKANQASPTSYAAERRRSMRPAASETMSSSGSTSSGLSMISRGPERRSSLRAPQHHPHARASKFNASSWTLESDDEGEPAPRLYPRPPPPARSQKSLNSIPSPPRQKPRTSSLETAATKVKTRPLYQSARIAATRATVEPGYPYRAEPALCVPPKTRSRPVSQEVERRITDTLSGGELVSEPATPSDSDAEAESEEVASPVSAPDGMDAFTSRVHIASRDARNSQFSLSTRSSTSTLASFSDGGHSEYLSSVSSQPRDRWTAMSPDALDSTAHLALEAQLEEQLQAQLAKGDDVSNDDDCTIRCSEAVTTKSAAGVFPVKPSIHQVKINTTVHSAPPRAGDKRGSPLKGPRSPPRTPISRFHTGITHRDSVTGLTHYESPPRLPQVQKDSWRFNSPPFGLAHASWAAVPRSAGKCARPAVDPASHR